ncbi:MAG: GNAT family N-acetyltransferase [Candidatus Acidiferrum sp.]
MNYPILNLELAKRIEFAEAEAAVFCAEALKEQGPGKAEIEKVAGGVAIYCGANSPVTQAVGLGLEGPVTKKDFEQLEEFYYSRNEPVRVETCPLADTSLFGFYGDRGYRVTEFSNVMARPVPANYVWDPVPGVEIALARREELKLWTLTVSQCFAEHYPVTEEILNVMQLFATSKNTECYLARMDGRVVGGATLSLRGKTAGFFGAGTLLGYRNRGVQTALLHARLGRAGEAGCDLAVSLALPGSHSQRNITRLGFHTLYTRVKFEKEKPVQG